MSLTGLALCSRYSYPPNSLSLCGPDKKSDLNWYSENQKTDRGTLEILSQFSTLYPYLTLIASENKIKDPFEKSVVEAYWVGNNLLHRIPITSFVSLLSNKIDVKAKIKIANGALPHHSFHVLNVYKRTGHLDILHTVETMDACLINWGKVKRINNDSLVIETKPIALINNKLEFGKLRERTVIPQGEKDVLFRDLKTGDWISYHWGYFCHKLSSLQLRNLIYYTNLSLNHANGNEQKFPIR